MAEADAEQRLARLQQLPDHRHRIFAGRGRVAGAVGEEEAVGLVRHHLVEAWRWRAARSPARRRRRGCGRCCAWSRSRSRRRAGAPSLARAPMLAIARSPSDVPAVPPDHASNICRQDTSLARSMPSSPGHSARLGEQRLDVELAAARCGRSRRSARPAPGSGGSAPGCRRPTSRSARSPSSSVGNPGSRGSCSAPVTSCAHDAAQSAADCPPPHPRNWRRHCRCAGR